MNDQEHLLQRYTEAAALDLPPIRRKLAERLELSAAQEQQLGEALAQAWLLGAHFGAVEVTAQSVEGGIDVRLNLLGGPESPESHA